MRKDEEQEYAELLKLAYEAEDALDTWWYAGGKRDIGVKASIADRVTGEILRAKKIEAWNQVKFCKRRLGIELE